MKEVIVKILKKALKKKAVSLKDEEILNLIEVPPSQEMGDYAFPCFFLSKQLHDNPSRIAIELREKMGNAPATDLEDIQTQGPYINFFVNRKSLARQVIWDAITQKKNFGESKLGKGKRTMIEFPSPNTNKPLHLGHLRNMAIGESISRILEFNDEKVIRANMNNDRGIHICKSMLAYKKWGREKTPTDKKEKSDHFVGDFYVMFNKKKTKKLEAEAQEMLQKWEAGDKNTLLLWKLMNGWALDGFKETYKKFEIKHDVNYFESKIYKKGKEMILDGVKKGLFTQEKSGEVKIDLSNEKLGEKILLRKDGTSVYIVFDLALAKIKFEDYKLNKSFYVVGNEQDYHFKVLFSLLEKLGFKDKEMKHISYGLVNLPTGRMKSREGTVVDADDLIERVRLLAEKELSKRDKLSKTELKKRSLIIALASIKYLLLKVDINKNMLFNPKESVSFDGDTGPYILYSYARASSIMEKASLVQKKTEVNELEEKDIALVKKLSQFPEIVESAYKNLNPSLIANYSYQLAQIFNEFYHNCKVIGSEEEAFRLALVQSFRQVLKNSLSLIGIETLDKM
ncbi:MAG: arginine--tRNA ligase [Nanoarchaeota archaeon]|nr:arginine--tRNA ligase [Nanoarchaeota archaeon]MBU1501539.1 arginine--tRNA ligase [Nanoarchaeota archaeon]MBU2459158.1 arginine--tRNA ligase [Nanoarchaeota archaeon]